MVAPTSEVAPEHFIDSERFEKRLRGITDDWDSFGGSGASAFEVVLGKHTDEAKMSKATALSNFFFGLEFTDTVMVVLRDGNVHIISGTKKIGILNQVKSDKVHLYPRADDNAESINTIFEAVKAVGGSIGVNMKEKLVGKFTDEWKSALQSGGITTVDFGSFYSNVLMGKDEEEVKNIKKSANVSIAMMRIGFIHPIEDIIENDKKVAHSKVCAKLENIFDNDDKMDNLGKQYSFDPNYANCEFAQLQSGTKFDLRAGLEPNDENLDSKCIIAGIGTTVKEYRAGIIRTFVVDASAQQKAIYRAIISTFDYLVSLIKPGITLGELHGKTDEYLSGRCGEVGADIKDKVVKSFGHTLGLEWRDAAGVIKPGSTTVVQPGMAFFIHIGLGNLETKRKGKTTKYALWIGDTVQVPLEGDGNATVITDAIQKSDNEVFYCLDDDVDDVEINDLKTQAAQKVNKRPERDPMGINAANIVGGTGLQGRVTRQSKRRAVQDNTDEINRIARLQEKLRKEKMKECELRFKGHDQDDTLDEFQQEVRAMRHLDNCRSYTSTQSYPEKIMQRKCFVDPVAECLFVCIQGSFVPFHVKTIKNVAQTGGDGGIGVMRVNFNTPGSGLTIDLFPRLDGDDKPLYIKEFNVRGPKNSMNGIVQQVKDLIKVIKTREEEAIQRRNLKEQPALELLPKEQKGKAILRDCDMKPSLSRGKTRGMLVGHRNGFRFVSNKGERCDVIYSNIKQAIFQPIENDNKAIVHFHLRDGIMIGKKKWSDIQFNTELGMEAEDVNARRNMYDPEGFQEEERMRKQKIKINEIFKDFVDKAEKQGNLLFDMPYRELGFQGVPNRTTEWVYPGKHCLMSLNDWPSFVMGLDDIEVVSLERVNYAVRNFDMVFIYKDYNKPTQNITIIPTDYLEKIKAWLTENSLVYYENKVNLNWQQVMKSINGSLDEFAEGQAWQGVLGEDSEDEEQQSILDGDSSYEESEDDLSDDDDDFDEDDDSDAPADDSDEDYEDSEPEPDEDDDDEETWSEQERRMEKEDRERGQKKRTRAVKKKPRRGDEDSDFDDDMSIDSDRPSKKPRRR